MATDKFFPDRVAGNTITAAHINAFKNTAAEVNNDEASWLPAIRFSGGNGTINVDTRGQYVSIEKFTFFTANAYIYALGTASGDLYCDIPVSCNSFGGAYPHVVQAFVLNYAGVVMGYFNRGASENGKTGRIQLLKSDGSALKASDLPSAFSLAISGHYEIS